MQGTEDNIKPEKHGNSSLSTQDLHANIQKLGTEMVRDAKFHKKQHYTNILLNNRTELITLLNGFIITLSLFVILNGFTHGLVANEHNRLSEQTANFLSESVESLESTMGVFSTMLKFANQTHQDEIWRKAGSSINNVNYFDEILWIYEDQKGQWVYKSLYKREGSKETSIDQHVQLANDVIARDPFRDEQVYITNDFLNLENFYDTGISESLMSQPLVVYRAIEADNQKLGVVIGTANLRYVIQNKWKNHANFVSKFRILDTSNNKIIYAYSREGVRVDNAQTAHQEYIFSFGKDEWKLEIEFFEDQTIFWLEHIPFIVLFFGGLFTITIIFYVRNNKSKAQELESVNQTLESKNFELEIEITERERLNKVLRREERENRAIIDAVSDIIFETDTSGKIEFLSLAWEKVTGFDINRGMGQNLFEMLHPEDQMAKAKDFNMLVKGHKQPYRSMTRIRTADGTFRAIELAFSMIRQDDSKDLRVVGTMNDVEERRRAENALNEAEKKYKAIVENAAGGIYQMTPEGLYLSANPAMARILGYDSPDEILRDIKNANEAVYVDHKARMKFIHDLVNMGSIDNYEVEVYTKDGRTIWVNENVHCVYDETGNILYHEGSIEDITQRKESEVAMVQAKVESDIANRAKNEFLANMSHELRTPLNSIIGFSEIIKNEVFGEVPKDYQEYAKDIHESGQGLLKIINEILDISRIEAKERELNESLVDIRKMSQSCVDLIAGRFEAKQLTVSLQLDGTPKIIAEELAMKQILMNLLSNAIKFTPEGGRVTLSYEVDNNGELRFSVTDTGVGLSEGEIDKAMEAFGQIDTKLSRSGSGTGLGLTLVDLLIKLHAGRFELFSQKGIGTSATVILPVDRVVMKSDEDIESESLEQQYLQHDNATKH